MALQPLAISGFYAISQTIEGDALLANAHLVVTDDGNLLIDPLPMDEETHAHIARLGGVALVVVTMPARARDARAIAERYGAVVIDRAAHRQPLLGGAFAIALAGQRMPEAFAIVVPSVATVIAGEAVLGTPGGAVSFDPALDGESAVAAALGLRAILRENPQRLLVARGQSIYSDAYAVLYRLLYGVAGAAVHRINLDELEFTDDDDGLDEHTAQFRVADAEVGFAIGARSLGYRVSTLLPGRRFCPLHGHAREEEMFFVLDGRPSVRTLNRTIECRKGDFIAFPVGESGTHELFNASDAPATVLLLGRTEEVEACYYPDSDKLLVDTPMPFAGGRHSTMVKASPVLAYFHGEGGS